jgi:hypothetical protein
MAHEVAHASGIRSERAADAEALRILAGAGVNPGRADLRAALDVFARPSGSGHVDRFFGRLRDLLRYGSHGGRLADLERAARGEEDPFARYRRADGTIRWKPLTRDGALREAGGLAHFTLALFLKELAVVVSTGDRLRIEEFFDGLLTTDFFATYGLFALGARGGEIAYSRFLARHLRPGFVSSLLKTQVVLMTGMALPAIVRGELDGKTFMISAASLGLSISAVRAGVAGIGWVYDLRAPRSAGLVARLGPTGRRLARLGGWFYSAAELAVVLYLGEKIQEAYSEWDDRREAKRALADAGQRFLATAGDPDALAADLALALRVHDEAWDDYRNYLYHPLHANEDRLNARLARLAVRSKRIANRTDGLLAHLGSHEHLHRDAVERYGDLETYAALLNSPDLSALREDTAAALEAYERGYAAALTRVYSRDRRAGSLLDGAPLRAGAVASALREVSDNRLQAYEDQAELLRALARRQRAAGRGDLAGLLEASRASVLRTREADRALVAAR